jgi:hypothetical protein
MCSSALVNPVLGVDDEHHQVRPRHRQLDLMLDVFLKPCSSWKPYPPVSTSSTHRPSTSNGI